jgi:hypothetical protein
MTVDDDLRMRQALMLAAADVEPAPDLADRARRGGRRRLRRRRTAWACAGAVLAVAALGGLLRSVAPRPDGPPPPLPASVTERLLDGETRGDLADDPLYLDAVVASHLADPLRSPVADVTVRPAGLSHVVWAGSTPAGRAAALAQPVSMSDGRGGVLMRFFADGQGGRPRLAGEGMTIRRAAQPETLAFVMDAETPVLVALDPGRPVELAAGFSYANGRVTRKEWVPLQFTDGAYVRPIPPSLAHQTAVRYRGGGGYIRIANVARGSGAKTFDGLGWADPPSASFPAARPAFFPLGDTAPSRDEASAACSQALDGTLPDEPDLTAETGVDWLAAGRAADGGPVVACDMRVGYDEMRSVVVVRDAAGRTVRAFGQAVHRGAVLPVAVRLPGDEGWFVARKDADLRYRTGTGAWSDAGRHAALLPTAATAVSVDGTEVPLRG